SRNFPPGTLVDTLNKLGMQFGPDTNAHTAWTETVYKLNLPDTKPETIALGLKIFNDYADGLLLTDEEIEEERGVIMEESRSRKSVQERIQKQTIKRFFEGTQLAAHDIIGTDEVITTAPRAEFVDFYDTWYRPELMTLIVVGDIRPDDVIPVAREALGSFEARAPAREPTPAGLQPHAEPRAFVFTDPEQVTGEVGVVALREGREPTTTYAQSKQEIVESIGEWMLNRRLRERVDKGEASYRGASASSFGLVNEIMIHSLDARGRPEDWQAMLDEIIVEAHRAVQHGFTEQELRMARAEFIANAEQALATEDTMDAGMLVAMLSNAVDSGDTYTSAATDLAIYQRVFEEITIDYVNKAFADVCGRRGFTCTLALPDARAELTIPDPAAVLAVADAAWSKPVEALSRDAVATSILEAQPAPGEIADTQTDEQLGITTITFANGVVMHHKFSDYKKEQAIISITLPGGTIEETADTKGLSTAGALIFSKPATDRLTSTQIRDLLVGKTVSFGGTAGLDAISLSVTGNPKDLATGLELAHATLTGGKLEQAALDEWKKNTLQALQMQKTSIEAQLMPALAESYYGGDVRLAMLTENRVNAITRDDAETWIRARIAAAPIEVAVVGDISLDRPRELIATYIGSLPKRQNDFMAFDHLRKLDRDPGPWKTHIDFATVTPKSVVFAGFPGADAGNVADLRAMNLAALVVSDRMNKRIREKEQLVYSIGAAHSAGRVMPGQGFIFAAAPTDPDKADTLADTVLEMFQHFADEGPTDDEMDMVRKQIATQLREQLQQPGFWAGQLADFTYRKRDLANLRDLPDAYQQISPETIREVASKYIRASDAIRIVIVPKPPATQPADAPKPE
ncbi:MAG TPA: insulinase family protein, partial [Tepidisphaeraceae bacterium]|nr:insulinase family protein [Tepidisphaeraceae bacterium]